MFGYVKGTHKVFALGDEQGYKLDQSLPAWSMVDTGKTLSLKSDEPVVILGRDGFFAVQAESGESEGIVLHGPLNYARVGEEELEGFLRWNRSNRRNGILLSIFFSLFPLYGLALSVNFLNSDYAPFVVGGMLFMIGVFLVILLPIKHQMKPLFSVKTESGIHIPVHRYREIYPSDPGYIFITSHYHCVGGDNPGFAVGRGGLAGNSL